MVKSELAASMAAVCLGGSTVPATVIIVVEYRLVYQLIGRSQAAKACSGGSTVPASGSGSQAYRREVLSTDRSSTGISTRSFSIRVAVRCQRRVIRAAV